MTYVDYGHLTPNNNLAENAIRPFVVGRKNRLFSGKPADASASAAIYSLAPYRYLRHLFERVPHATTAEDCRAPLPQHLYADEIAQLVPEGTGGSYGAY